MGSSLAVITGHVVEERYVREALKLNLGRLNSIWSAMAEALVATARYDDALAVLRKMVVTRPDWLMVPAPLIILHMALGEQQAAQQVIGNIVLINPRFTVTRWRQYLYYPQRADVLEMVQMFVDAGLPE
jgi:hypothetical protein